MTLKFGRPKKIFINVIYFDIAGYLTEVGVFHTIWLKRSCNITSVQLMIVMMLQWTIMSWEICYKTWIRHRQGQCMGRQTFEYNIMENIVNNSMFQYVKTFWNSPFLNIADMALVYQHHELMPNIWEVLLLYTVCKDLEQMYIYA